MSITFVPTAANFGAHSKEVSPPAENKAISGCKATASSKVTTVNSLPLYDNFFPADLAEATGISSVIGKLRSSNTFNITVPTIPVAPTTATFIFFSFNVSLNFKTFYFNFCFRRKYSLSVLFKKTLKSIFWSAKM